MIHRQVCGMAAAIALVAANACSAQPQTQANAPLPLTMSGCAPEMARVTPLVRPRHEEKLSRVIAQKNATVTSRKADVLFFGDSILQRWPDSELAGAFPGKTIMNLGLAGDRVADLSYRLRASIDPATAADLDPGLKNLRNQSPSKVVVLIGTNDLRGKDQCYIARGTLDIVSLLHTLYPRARVTVLAILPRGADFTDFADKIAAVNRAVADTARRTGAFETADIAGNFRCSGPQPCNLAQPRNYVHPTPEGYAILDAALKSKVGAR